MTSLTTRRPLRQARHRRAALFTLIVGGGTIAAMSLAALAFAMVSSAWAI